MKAAITLFGQLTDIAGSNIITVNNITDTESLVQEINKVYPSMASVKYIIAIDKKIVKENTVINAGSNVALLPPFSGG